MRVKNLPSIALEIELAVKRHVGSNPTFSARKRILFWRVLFYLWDSKGGY